MENIQIFAKKHTVVYCILAEAVVLGGMMAGGILISFLMRESGADSYVQMALQELFGALLAFAAMKLGGCADILHERGIGLGKGLLVGGYFLVIGVYSGVLYMVIYDGPRTLRPWYLIVTFVICMLLVGITEEFLCRGVLAELLLRHFGATKNGVWKAVIVSGILFGLAHLTNLAGAEPVGVLVQCVIAGMMGMAFAAIYFRTGCIWVTVVLHALVDTCALITSGLYDAGDAAEVISGYQPYQLVSVVPYTILLLVLLRKKKMNRILAMRSPVDEKG